MYKGSSFSTSSLTFELLFIITIINFRGTKYYLVVTLICLSLIINDMEYFSIFFSATTISSLAKYLLSPLPIFYWVVEVN